MVVLPLAVLAESGAAPGPAATNGSPVTVAPPQTIGAPLFPPAAAAAASAAAAIDPAALAEQAAAVRAMNAAVFDAMWSFEPRLVAAQVATVQGDGAAARAAAQGALEAWPEFNQSCQAASPQDPRLNETLDAAAKHLREATALLAQDQLEPAREQLQSLRTELMRLRARMGLDYLPDYLTRYGHPLEAALAMGAKLNATNATRADFLVLRDHLIAVRGYWMQFMSAPRIDPARYRFTPAQLAELTAAVQANGVALKELESAFEGGDYAKMLAALQAMQPAYTRLLNVAGGATPGS